MGVHIGLTVTQTAVVVVDIALKVLYGTMSAALAALEGGEDEEEKSP